MATIAILGYGTVGSGVLEVLRRNRDGIARRLGEELSVKYICDIRDFSSHPDAQLFVRGIEPILADGEVKLVVETIGGTKPAYEFVSRALESGRHVVTSNKELVATHGAALLAKAKAHGVCFLFEASVGGGTPIITPMHQCLSANTIASVTGIVNGTTNYMLAKMEHDGFSFDEALKSAQDLGYAETVDPSSDVDGIDACRKISILASLLTGRHVYPQNVPTRGIRPLTLEDMEAAKRMGAAAKLIAWARTGEEGALSVGVEPMMVKRKNQLAGVDDVYNAVLIEGDMLGEVLFYGKGAGKLPTASAVVADAIDALKEGVKIHDSLFWQPAQPIEGQYADDGVYEYYVRAANKEGAAKLAALPGAQALDGLSASVLPGKTPAELAALLAWLAAEGEPALAMKILP